MFNTKPLKEGSKPKGQNIHLEYDITLQELPDHLTKNTDIEVSTVKESKNKNNILTGLGGYHCGRMA